MSDDLERLVDAVEQHPQQPRRKERDMGFGFLDHLFDSDWRQREDILELQECTRRQNNILWRRSAQQKRQDEEKSATIKELQDAVGALTLLCKGMMGMLREKGVWDEQAFRRVCKKADLADGKEDGKAPIT